MTIDKIKSLLRGLGLTNREIETYLTLLRKGECSASALSRDSSISRTHIYETLKSLMDKGFVACVDKDFKKYYSAADPQRIIGYIENEESELRQKKKLFLGHMDLLKNLKSSALSSPKVFVYQGREGTKTILADFLYKPETELLVLNGTKHFRDLFGFHAKHFFKEKNKKKITSKVIFSEKFNFLDPRVEKRFMLNGAASPATTVIYRDRVAILCWLEKTTAIVIENEEIAREYRNYFNILWKKASLV